MTRPRRTVILVLVAAVLSAAIAACGSSSSGSDPSGSSAASRSGPTVPVRIARTGYFDPLALGQADGSLTKAIEAAGGKPSYTAPFGAFAPVAEALNGGSVDIGVGSITSAIGGFIGKSGYTIFAAIPPENSDEGVLVPKGSPIHSVSQLVGKSVVVNKAGTGEYLLLKALAVNHIPASKVKRVYLPPTSAGSAFASGQLQAWSTWGTFTDIARASHGARLLVGGAQIGSQNDQILVVRNGFLSAHPSIVKAIFNAARAESIKNQDDPAAATALGNKSAGLPANVAALQTVAFQQQPPLEAITPSVLHSFQQVADFFHAQGVTPTTAEMSQHVVNLDKGNAG